MSDPSGEMPWSAVAVTRVMSYDRPTVAAKVDWQTQENQPMVVTRGCLALHANLGPSQPTLTTSTSKPYAGDTRADQVMA